MTLALWPLQAISMRRGWRLQRRLPQLWHRIAAPVAGIRVLTVGAPAAPRPLLIVANHQSWADIVVLGQAMELSFIAKEEVRSWPGFGLLARLQRTVFVSRERRRGVGTQADAIAERLAAGDAMVLFAEGTTSDGNGVLPFRTALFGAVEGALKRSGEPEMTVQPVSVAWLAANGLPLGRFGRPLAAWPGAVPLVPHLPRFLAEGSLTAELRFGRPVRFAAGDDRKALAKACERQVRQLLATSLAGHGFRLAPAAEQPARETVLASSGPEADTAHSADGTFQKGA
ncbi:1-acyl-sn-glycerol-3-phosphate acyltransferase [Aureimonas leprariae]|uniref:1-acyl-sn-glycerol-3-phosphate acyltransferase n=2 Tax=Plantimonas leprariae TaxID=2615207 RepID=A0A7V7TYQ1_9HYPH|nr:lysophospholipid acyltransferase family protein [Aureimonas leprariae]KAB0683011.1 1-acyl-sn-glycerol-3-phosphate acyltransferase [Aureimonas leprariae]